MIQMQLNWIHKWTGPNMAYRSAFFLKKNVSQCIENLLVQGRGFSVFFKPWPHIQARTSSSLQMCRRIFCSPGFSKDLLTESYSETQRMSWELAQRLWGAPGTWRGPHCKWQNKSTSTEGRSVPGNGLQPCDTSHPDKLQPKDPEIEILHISGNSSPAMGPVMVPSMCLIAARETLCSWQHKAYGTNLHSLVLTVFSFWREVTLGLLGIWSQCMNVHQREVAQVCAWASCLLSLMYVGMYICIYSFSFLNRISPEN